MRRISWRLGEELQARGVSAYRLAQALGTQVSRTTVYALASGKPDGVQFTTLAAVMTALEELSGQAVSLSDLLKVEEVAHG